MEDDTRSTPPLANSENSNIETHNVLPRDEFGRFVASPASNTSKSSKHSRSGKRKSDSSGSSKSSKAKRVKPSQLSSAKAGSSSEASQVISGTSSVDAVAALVLVKVLQHLQKSSSSSVSVADSSAADSLPRIGVRNPPIMSLGDTEGAAVLRRTSQVSMSEPGDSMPKVDEQRLSVSQTERLLG